MDLLNLMALYTQIEGTIIEGNRGRGRLKKKVEKVDSRKKWMDNINVKGISIVEEHKTTI